MRKQRVPDNKKRRFSNQSKISKYHNKKRRDFEEKRNKFLFYGFEYSEVS